VTNRKVHIALSIGTKLDRIGAICGMLSHRTGLLVTAGLSCCYFVSS